jgi:predicted acyltransferase
VAGDAGFSAGRDGRAPLRFRDSGLAGGVFALSNPQAGLVSTASSILSPLGGIASAGAMRSHSHKLKVLGACAAGAFVLGLALEPFNPMMKRLWTASFTLSSTGWIILILMALYWIVDVNRQSRRFPQPYSE